MSRVYFYKLVADNGGAPCVQDGLLSLAICKPIIRTTAEPDDLIFGFAANSLHPDNRLLYIARVTEKVREGDYYIKEQFQGRGDCVYERRGDRFYWREKALHHGPEHLEHDLGVWPDYPKTNVLLSSDFRYFGANGAAEYKTHYPLIKDAVENLGRGHRVNHEEALRLQLLALKDRIWQETPKGAVGKQTSAPNRSVCHRSRSCGFIGSNTGCKK